MSARMFPFWIAVLPRRQPPVVLAQETPSHFAAAFTSLEKAQAFVGESGDRDWEARLVCRDTFPTLADSLRRYQLRGLCFDPDQRGRGEVWELAQIEHCLPGEVHAQRQNQPAPDSIRLCSHTSSLLKESSALQERSTILREELGKQIAESHRVLGESQQRRESSNSRRCG